VAAEVELRVDEQQGTMRELTLLLLQLEVDGGRWSMVSFTRKMTAVDHTHPEALLTGSSGCRWLLHEGEWVTPFRSAQWRTRCPGGAERRQTEAATESGGKSEQGA
jgi:hypothetical protein